MEVEVTDPNGVNRIDHAMNSTSDSIQVSGQKVANGGNGEWEVNLAPDGADLKISYNIVSVLKEGSQPLSINLSSYSGNTVTYPEPMIVTAAISKGAPITDVNVSLVVTDENNNSTTMQLTDDGKGIDGYASDGIYSGIIEYKHGSYSLKARVDNNQNQAQYTADGGETKALDGSPPSS